MSERFPWDPRYETGVANIDDQHRNLFRIASQVFATDDPDRLQALVMELYRHTRHHFRDEEGFLKDVGFPDLARHRDQHDAILERLNGYAARLEGDPAQVAALRDFLEGWIREHILEHDQEVALGRHRPPEA
jgi:hemerythrin